MFVFAHPQFVSGNCIRWRGTNIVVKAGRVIFRTGVPEEQFAGKNIECGGQ